LTVFMVIISYCMKFYNNLVMLSGLNSFIEITYADGQYLLCDLMTVISFLVLTDTISLFLNLAFTTYHRLKFFEDVSVRI
jgi:hypothetical protein